MLVSSRPALALILTPALLAGCAAIPRSRTPIADIAALDCQGLAAEQALAERTRDAADRARRSAWKAVLPIAVGVRYASANSALSDAQRRLQLVGARRSAQRCAPAADETEIVDLGAEV